MTEKNKAVVIWKHSEYQDCWRTLQERGKCHFRWVTFVGIPSRLLTACKAKPGDGEITSKQEGTLSLGVGDSYGERGESCAKTQLSQLHTGEILSGKPRVQSGPNSGVPE